MAKNIFASTKNFDKYSWIFNFLLNSIFCCVFISDDTTALSGRIDFKLRVLFMKHHIFSFFVTVIVLGVLLRKKRVYSSHSQCHILKEDPDEKYQFFAYK